MTAIQTRNGAVSFLRVVPDVSAGQPTMVHLRDGVTVGPDTGGGFHVRTVDLPGLQAAGLVVGAGAAGASSLAQFQAGVLSGVGAGTAT